MGNIFEGFREIVKKCPDHIAITHHLSQGRANHITFSDLDKRSDLLADCLESHGVKPGLFAGIYMQKSVEHAIAIIAMIKAGAVFYSINSRAKLPQVEFITNLSHTKVLFIDNSTIINFHNMDHAQNIDLKFIHYSMEKMGLIYEEVLKKMENYVDVYQFIMPMDKNCYIRKSSPWIVDSDAALALFTSGSTGTSKGVMISHQDLHNRVQTEIDDYEINKNDCLLSLLPFSFDVGCNQLFTALLTGARLVILNSWLPRDICSVIKEYKVTGISGVPAIWAGILDYGEDEIKEAFSKVRYITISGGDMPPHHLRELKDIINHVGIYKTYGQTETFRSSILKPHEFGNKMMSVGRPVKGTEVVIRNKKGEKAAANELGEILHRGEGMMMGYLGDPHGTKQKIRRNPFQDEILSYPQEVIFTGDIGRFDEEGYLYVHGRKDKMIKTSGFRVYPKEIVDQILAHPWVKDAVVLGVKDEKTGSSIFCEIQLKKGHILSEVEMKKFLSDKLPPYMIPSKIFFIESFPRTSSGKIRFSEVEKKYNG